MGAACRRASPIATEFPLENGRIGLLIGFATWAFSKNLALKPKLPAISQRSRTQLLLGGELPLSRPFLRLIMNRVIVNISSSLNRYALESPSIPESFRRRRRDHRVR